MIDQVLRDLVEALVAHAVKGRLTAVVNGIDVHLEIFDAVPHGFERLLFGARVLTRVELGDAGRDHQRGHVFGSRDRRVRAERDEQLHHHRVDALGRQQKRRRARPVQPVAVAVAHAGGRHALVDIRTLGDKQFGQREAVHGPGTGRRRQVTEMQSARDHQLLQRRDPTAECIRIRPLVEEIGGHFPVRIDDRQEEWCRAVGRRFVDLRAHVEQRLHRIKPARTNGKQQRRQSFRHGSRAVGLDRDIPALRKGLLQDEDVAALFEIVQVGVVAVGLGRRRGFGNLGRFGGGRLGRGHGLVERLTVTRRPGRYGPDATHLRMRVDIAAGLNQHLERRDVPLGGGPHQGVLPARLLHRVQLRAVREQHLHRVRRAVPRRLHQRRFAVRHRDVGVGAGLEQPLLDRRVAIKGCQAQRLDAVARDGADVGARREQGLDDRDVVVLHGDVQRRHAIRRRRVHVCLLRQRGLHSLDIAQFHRREQRCPARRPRGRGRGHEGQHTRNEDALHVYSSASSPVLSPSLSCGAPSLRRRLRCMFVMRVSCENLR